MFLAQEDGIKIFKKVFMLITLCSNTENMQWLYSCPRRRRSKTKHTNYPWTASKWLQSLCEQRPRDLMWKTVVLQESWFLVHWVFTLGFFFLFCLLTLKIIWNSRQLVAQGWFTLNLFSFNLMGLVSKADYCGSGDVQRPVRVWSRLWHHILWTNLFSTSDSS